MFHTILGKVFREGEKGFWNPVKVGRKLEAACLVFADKLVLLPNSMQRSSEQQLETHCEYAGELGQQSPLRKQNSFARNSTYKQ